MKKFILFIVVAFLTFGANAADFIKAQKAIEKVTEMRTQDKKQIKTSDSTEPTGGIGETITVYVADSVDTDTLTSKINDGANVQVLKFEKLPEPEKEWYEKTWVVYLMMGMLIVALFLAIMATVGGADEKEVKRDIIKSVRGEIDDRIRLSSQSMSGNSSINDLTKKTRELTDKMNDMRDEIELLKQHQSSATTQQNAGNHQNFGEALRPKEVKLYATVLDENTLMNVGIVKSSKLPFVISLKSNSDNEGTYEIINDQETQQRWLQNSDMQRCCVKVGNGNTIVSQVPGKVAVDRQSGKATITVKAKIYIK